MSNPIHDVIKAELEAAVTERTKLLRVEDGFDNAIIFSRYRGGFIEVYFHDKHMSYRGVLEGLFSRSNIVNYYYADPDCLKRIKEHIIDIVNDLEQEERFKSFSIST